MVAEVGEGDVWITPCRGNCCECNYKGSDMRLRVRNEKWLEATVWKCYI